MSLALIGFKEIKMQKWLKSNWPTLLVFFSVLFISLWAKGSYEESKLEEVQQKYSQELSTQRKSYDKQIENINKANEEVLEKQKILLEEYKRSLDFAQLEYDNKVKELQELRELKIKELTKNINKNPEEVLENLAQKFGFEVVKVEE